MKFLQIFLICILIVSPFLINNVFAQDGTEETTTQETTNDNNSTEIVEVKVGPSPHASTEFLFPNSTNNRFYIGKPTTVVVALNNKADHAFNVHQIGASLMYPQDHRYFIQNYTRFTYNQSVSSSELQSFRYTFSPDAMLEPRPYGLVISIHYSDMEGTNFTHVVFNNTIELIETDESIDAQALFLYVGVLGVAGLIGFLVYKSVRQQTNKKGPKRTEYGTQRATVIDNDWLQGTSAMRSPKNRTPNVRKPKKIE